MKRLILILIAYLVDILTTGVIYGMTMSVYIPQETKVLLSANSSKILKNKLEAVIKAGGAYTGNDSRYILVPKISIIDESITPSYPAQNVVKINITYCVGDGVSGNLFDTESFEYRGIGEDRLLAVQAAITKINPSAKELRTLISTVQKKIVNFYDETGPEIINNAKLDASGSNFENAISLLMGIPKGCTYYEQAQELALSYAGKILDRDNLMWLNKAKAEWSSSPDNYGANKACQYISNIVINNSVIQKKVNTLISEINHSLKEDKKNQMEIQLKQIESETAIKIAKTEANARIAASIADGASSIISGLIRFW